MSDFRLYACLQSTSAGGDLDRSRAKPLRKCARCPALIARGRKYCGPCSADVIDEQHRTSVRRRQERRKREAGDDR